MTKLIVSSGKLSSGGAERVLSILSEPFASHYDEVVYLTWIDVPDFYTIDARIKRVCVERECGSKNIMKKALWFRSFIKREKPTVVLSFLAPFNVMISFALIGVNTKLIVAERNDPRCVMNGLVQRNLRKAAYMMVDGILEQTENNKKYFTGSLSRKTDVIYNPMIMKDTYLGKALCTEKQRRIVSVARLKKQKNPEMQLKAFKLFLEMHPDYTMTMYGDGDYRYHVESMVKELGLEGKVLLPGAVKDVWDEIVNAECFVMTSWYEGMPNALLEAMCLGLPCVSTKVSGAVDLIESGKNGILIGLDDHKAMAQAMSEVCDDKALSSSLGSEAVKLYEKLKLEVISKQWLDYIDRIIADIDSGS